MHTSAPIDRNADQSDTLLQRYNARLLSKEERKAVAHLFPKKENILQRLRKFIGISA
jgi:hypothetical protein